MKIVTTALKWNVAFVSLVAWPATLLFSAPMWAEEANRVSLETVEVMALGALDGRAVVKTADSRMHIVKVGSVIPGTKATVVQILSDKLVLEDGDVSDGSGRGQTVWVTKSSSQGAVTVQRFQKQGPPSEVHEVTGATLVESNKAKEKNSKKGEK